MILGRGLKGPRLTSVAQFDLTAQKKVSFSILSSKEACATSRTRVCHHRARDADSRWALTRRRFGFNLKEVTLTTKEACQLEGRGVKSLTMMEGH